MTTIVHTTDLTDADRTAFEHSVALARAGGARLVSLHANAPEDTVAQMPDAGSVLLAWGDQPDTVEFTKRVHSCCDDPVDSILDAVRSIDPDLVVAATHKRSAVARFVVGSRAEAIAHNVRAPTLLFPAEARGFVDSRGALDLSRVLVPIGDDEPEAAAALHAAAQLAELADADRVEFLLVHVGERFPATLEPLQRRPGWTMKKITVEQGEIEAGILAQAKDACVLVMATRGHDSVGDVLLGSHTDRVLHGTRCPVLSVSVP